MMWYTYACFAAREPCSTVQIVNCMLRTAPPGPRCCAAHANHTGLCLQQLGSKTTTPASPETRKARIRLRLSARMRAPQPEVSLAKWSFRTCRVCRGAPAKQHTTAACRPAICTQATLVWVCSRPLELAQDPGLSQCRCCQAHAAARAAAQGCWCSIPLG